MSVVLKKKTLPGGEGNRLDPTVTDSHLFNGLSSPLSGFSMLPLWILNSVESSDPSVSVPGLVWTTGMCHCPVSC